MVTTDILINDPFVAAMTVYMQLIDGSWTSDLGLRDNTRSGDPSMHYVFLS